MYHMMSTPALLKSNQRKAPRSPLSSQDSNAPKSADIKCGSLLISRQHRKDLSSVASITPLAQALIRGEVRWKEQMPFSILAARLCLVGSKVGARVQSLGNVLERGSCDHCRDAAQGLCAVMQEEEDGHFQVRKVVELGVYSTATATVELVECPSEDLIS